MSPGRISVVVSPNQCLASASERAFSGPYSAMFARTVSCVSCIASAPAYAASAAFSSASAVSFAA
jgi:hypothetical protein